VKLSSPEIVSSQQPNIRGESLSNSSLYEFGGDEELVRRIQTRFVSFFAGCERVLDIGCGRGIFLELLKKSSIKGIGIDPASESIEACRKKGFSDVVREDAVTYLARHTREFDGIFCSHVIEHMSYEDAVTFLRLCSQALRPGGVLVLITPNPQDLTVISEIFWLDPTHIRPYPLRLLTRMVETAGFRVTLAEAFLGSWRLIGRRKLPVHLLRRCFLGHNYGRPNTLVVGRSSRN